MAWRLSLKEGDKIDVVRKHDIGDLELKGWVQATITSIEAESEENNSLFAVDPSN